MCSHFSISYPQNNYITRISNDSLPSDLEFMSFDNNPIQTIDDDAFVRSATSLERLTFSNARFTKIPNAFQQLTALTSLSISNTPIVDWNPDVMKHLGSRMEVLALENVSLTEWPSWLQNYTQLTDLTIGGKSISSIPEDAFDNVINSLQTLAVSNTSFIEVPKAVSKLHNLNSLSFIYSRISNLTWLPGKLNWLVIQNARISDADHVRDALRPLADSLTQADFQANQLTKIPDVSFMTSLQILQLMNNKIADPVSGAVPAGLNEIDLSYNLLHAIPRIFPSLHSLTLFTLPWNNIMALTGSDFPPSTTEADFQSNLITQLSDTSFPENSSIEILTLNNNPLSTISAGAIHNLPHLQSLKLANTKITRLPISFASLSNLLYFDVTGTQNLVCTCLEASLRPVILKLDTLLGDCGSVSIRYFFDILSPSCPS